MLNFNMMKLKILILFSACTLAFGLMLEYKGLLKPELETILYAIPVLSGLLWMVLNFVLNMKDTYFTRHQQASINAYIKKLQLEKEEEVELRDYMMDYIADLQGEGMEEKEALKKAMKEFNLSKPMKWYSQYTYLLTLVVVCGISTALLNLCLNTVGVNIWLLVLQNTFFTYGIAFLGTYVIYQIATFALRNKRI